MSQSHKYAAPSVNRTQMLRSNDPRDLLVLVSRQRLRRHVLNLFIQAYLSSKVYYLYAVATGNFLSLFVGSSFFSFFLCISWVKYSPLPISYTLLQCPVSFYHKYDQVSIRPNNLQNTKILSLCVLSIYLIVTPAVSAE